MASKTPLSLLNFFVFNSTYGPREGEEHKKILYYYPPDVDIDTKIKDIGLCEAIIKFTETFSDKPCQSLHTQKRRQMFFQPEPEFWMVMTLSVPTCQKTKEGQIYTEFQEDDVQDSVFDAILQQAYKMFKLFKGSFNHVLTVGNVQDLKDTLSLFFSRYLPTIRLAFSDLLDVFYGIQFLPLDKNTYLRIQCLINLLEARFPSVIFTAFLYNDQLVWSGLGQEDMRVLYRYLVTSLFPTHLEQELQGTMTTARPVTASGQAHYGWFMTGPSHLEEGNKLGYIPHVFVNSEKPDQECHLVVYRAHSATLVLIVEGTFELSLEFFRTLDGFLGPQLTSLASAISDQYGKKPTVSSSAEIQFKYIYFNHMNLAQKTTVHTDPKKAANMSIPSDVLRLLADLNHDLTSVTAVEDGETIVKTNNDCWVVGKKSDQREFYVVIHQKNANLIDINEEVKKLCSTHFSNIFFLD